MLQSQSNMCTGLTIVTQVRNTHRGGETNGLLPIRDPFSRESLHQTRILSHRRKLKWRSGSNINYDVSETTPAQWLQINCEYLLTCSHTDTDLRSLSSSTCECFKGSASWIHDRKKPRWSNSRKPATETGNHHSWYFTGITAVLCSAVLWAVLCVRKGKEKIITNQKIVSRETMERNEKKPSTVDEYK